MYFKFTLKVSLSILFVQTIIFAPTVFFISYWSNMLLSLISYCGRSSSRWHYCRTLCIQMLRNWKNVPYYIFLLCYRSLEGQKCWVELHLYLYSSSNPFPSSKETIQATIDMKIQTLTWIFKTRQKAWQKCAKWKFRDFCMMFLISLEEIWRNPGCRPWTFDNFEFNAGNMKWKETNAVLQRILI
jgi:hypothetical protein